MAAIAIVPAAERARSASQRGTQTSRQPACLLCSRGTAPIGRRLSRQTRILRSAEDLAISDKWKATVRAGIDDPAWDEYDGVIKLEISGYAVRFSVALKLPHVDWLLVKAMLWTESGGPSNPSWKTRPLQIGNPGDPAYAVLKSGAEGSARILTPELAQAVRTQIDDPKVNVKAGIGYLYTRMARFDLQSIVDEADPKVYVHTVKAGENLSRIAAAVGTTVAELERSNPTKRQVLQPTDQLNYRKARMGLVVSGWRPFTSMQIAERYNGGGDPEYAAKLDYLMKDVLPKLVRPVAGR